LPSIINYSIPFAAFFGSFAFTLFYSYRKELLAIVFLGAGLKKSFYPSIFFFLIFPVAHLLFNEFVTVKYEKRYIEEKTKMKGNKEIFIKKREGVNIKVGNYFFSFKVLLPSERYGADIKVFEVEGSRIKRAIFAENGIIKENEIELHSAKVIEFGDKRKGGEYKVLNVPFTYLFSGNIIEDISTTGIIESILVMKKLNQVQGNFNKYLVVILFKILFTLFTPLFFAFVLIPVVIKGNAGTERKGYILSILFFTLFIFINILMISITKSLSGTTGIFLALNYIVFFVITLFLYRGKTNIE